MSQLLTDDDFDSWLSREIKFTQRSVQKKNVQSIAPRLLVVGRGSEGEPISARVVTLATGLQENTKHETFAAIGAQLFTRERFVPLAAYFTSEAWASRQRIGSQVLQPSRDPARQEVVTIAARTIDGRDRIALAKIHRGPGDVIRLGPFTTMFEKTQCILLQALYEGFLRAGFRDSVG